MAATPNSNYSSSPSPSPSPPITQSRPQWNKVTASTGGWMHTPGSSRLSLSPSPMDGPGLYDLERDDEIPDITTLRVTDDDEEDSFHSPPPSQPQPQPTTQKTPHQSRTEKRFKKMADLGKEIPPHHLALGWMFLGIELRKSPVAQILRTGFNLKPSLEEVFEIESQLATEFNQVMRLFQRNNGRDQLCFVSFMRDLLEIPDLAMIRMLRVLAECKCCKLHQSRRPLCQEKKRQPGYDIFAQPENDCKCPCRHFTRKLEEALLGKYPLEVNGQLWERSL